MGPLCLGLLLFVSGLQARESGPSHEEKLIKRFEKEGEIPHYEKLQKLIGDFEEPRLTHYTHEELKQLLKELNKQFPGITDLYSIGRSVEGREMRVLVVSKFAKRHQRGVPEFKYVANMHGDETAGRVFLANIAWILLHNYDKNDYITRLVDTTRIHILPTMNPDGYASGEGTAVRHNANGLDLNRNFPPRFKSKSPAEIQPETRAVMKWSHSVPFVLSANLHGGTNLVNYPWDDHVARYPANGRYTPSPDNDLFVRIAYSFARSNSRMWRKCLKVGQEDSRDGETGITNGAYWYTVSGGMQDWLYVNTNSFDVTIEMSCDKFPALEHMQVLWEENKYALLEHIQQVHNAIHGQVVDSKTGQGIVNVAISMSPQGKEVHSFGDGEFWRLANLGTYDLTFSHPQYRAKTLTVTVTSSNRSPVMLVQLERRDKRLAQSGVRVEAALQFVGMIFGAL